MSTISRIPKKVLTLKQFMLRQEVLNLYREVLRTARKVDRHQKDEIIKWARSDFETHRSHTNEETIKGLLINGRQMVKELQSTIKKTS
ncbi:LYR motif-containing protein 2-like [Daphnia pulex]|uniref:LYR motif-containing protein 2-like n=1 Tax=Daphnia pulex TaxID=6669 RepID=UPI001EE036AF|nr:LYR motif-containing protein 2-like [Daphnia pulex]XP_046642875.1 LYR motif-containing protein 2-like [Daphnia pulicaria]